MDNKLALGLTIAGGALLVGGGAYLAWRQHQLAGLGRVVGSTSAGGMKLQHHRSRFLPIDQRVRLIQDLVWKSVQDPENRKLALDMTKHCPARDGMCEAKAIYDAVKKRVRYTGDVGMIKQGADGPNEAVDLFQSAKRTWEFGGGDCLPEGTRLLVEGLGLVPIEDVRPGQRIWGRDAWTEVVKVWPKGELPVDAVILNNDASFRATADHKVYIDLDGATERIPLGMLKEGTTLVQPRTLPSVDLWASSTWASGTEVAGRRVAPHGFFRRVQGDGPLVATRIRRAVDTIPTYDISTADHYVYLPDADVTVSNCDDHTILVSTMLALNGITPVIRVTASSKMGDFSHVYPLGQLPKGNPKGSLVALDTTLPGEKYGVEWPYSKKKDYAA